MTQRYETLMTSVQRPPLGSITNGQIIMRNYLINQTQPYSTYVNCDMGHYHQHRNNTRPCQSYTMSYFINNNKIYDIFTSILDYL